MSENKNMAYWGALAARAIRDPAALTELYEYYFPRVYQYLLGRTKDSSLADELVSDTFIRMYQHLEQFDPGKGAFSTWLFRSAQNALNKHFGSKAVTMHATWEDNFDPAADTATPEQQTLNTEEMTELREAIMQLSEREQRILEMTYWLDMKSGEVAKALGMTPDNVRHVLMEARKKLRVLLSAKEN